MEDRNGTLETQESGCQEAAAAEMEVARPPQQPSPNAASVFDFNQFFNIDHIPGLVVSASFVQWIRQEKCTVDTRQWKKIRGHERDGHFRNGWWTWVFRVV